MTMSSFLTTYRDWLYVAALIWNLAMIACFFWMSARRDADRNRMLQNWKERIADLRKLLTLSPRSRETVAAPERRNLEELIHFSRNPRAFNYTLQGIPTDPGSLLDEVQKRLAQSAVPNAATAPEGTDQLPAPADVPATERVLLENEQEVDRQLTNMSARRILTMGTFVNWILLALIAIGYFLRH
jgi:hypothetical protein